MTRLEFAQRLHSAVIPTGMSQEEMYKVMQPVSKAISAMMPSSLFRYRPLYDGKDDINNERQMEAFKNDTICALTADRFNDPYDTLIRYDQEEIKRIVNSIVNCETINGIKSWFAREA